jgi:anaerobic ribonucleoside-triphosphate reductase activating protein
MNYYNFQVVMQEVPGEISLCFNISGCPLKCDHCHSPFLWKSQTGTELNDAVFKELLEQYSGLASCVLFMGGEWEPENLIKHCKKAKERGYKTCLYTGLESIHDSIKQHLTYLKTGPFKTAKGGLDCPSTNQKFIEVASNKSLNHLFIKHH